VVQPKFLSFSEKVQIGVVKLRQPIQRWIPAQRAKPRDPAPITSIDDVIQEQKSHHMGKLFFIGDFFVTFFDHPFVVQCCSFTMQSPGKWATYCGGHRRDRRKISRDVWRDLVMHSPSPCPFSLYSSNGTSSWGLTGSAQKCKSHFEKIYENSIITSIKISKNNFCRTKCVSRNTIFFWITSKHAHDKS